MEDPGIILFCSEFKLRKSEQAVIGLIRQFKLSDKKFWGTNQYIADYWRRHGYNMSPRYVSKAVNALEAMGHIRIKNPNGKNRQLELIDY